MRTVNISLPESLAERVDKLLEQKEYASRSEVVRTALRVFFVLGKKEEYVELIPFQKRPLLEIKDKLRKEGYSSKFVESVTGGLKKSSLYNR